MFSLHLVSIHSTPLKVFKIVVIELTGVQFSQRCYSQARGSDRTQVKRLWLELYLTLKRYHFTAPFNNKRTFKFKAQPTNALFVTVNQMFGGSSQLPTSVERAVIKSNRRAQFRQHSRKLGGAADHFIDVG